MNILLKLAPTVCLHDFITFCILLCRFSLELFIIYGFPNKRKFFNNSGMLSWSDKIRRIGSPIRVLILLMLFNVIRKKKYI